VWSAIKTRKKREKKKEKKQGKNKEKTRLYGEHTRGKNRNFSSSSRKWKLPLEGKKEIQFCYPPPQKRHIKRWSNIQD